MLNRFVKDRSGNFAAMMGLMAIPLCLAVGLSVDYTRYLTAKNHLQDVTDAAALAMASSTETDKKKLQDIGEQIIAADINNARVENITVKSISFDDDKVDLDLAGNLPTTFMALGGFKIMPVETSALALRAVTGSVEVALVLDNTFSMSETDAKGVTKLDRLKSASTSLVDQLMSDSKAPVRIGLVPYADYVNVGTGYRNEPWLDVPADYTVAAVPKSGCTTESKEVLGACTAYAPSYDCSTYVDGVYKPKTCTGACTERKPSTWKNQETCTTPAKAAVNYKWYGCIGSRKTGTYRLNDTAPTVPYPGYVDTSQKCLNPIVPLSNNKTALKTALNGMVYSLGSYEPYTYIPAGLIWGINVLSPTAPLTEAAAYDLNNRVPRKALILMTDGENTRRFQSSDGKHVAFSSAAATAATQLATVNAETLTLCTYAKANKIEVYSVAFMVDDAAAKTMLETCASDKDHYFDASDSDKLLAAFSGIAASLTQVRLAR